MRTEPIDGALVSVIMATFNCEDTIGEALRSIEEQVYQSWELVVCDDGSEDDTFDLVEGFAVRHPGRVTVLRNDENRKLSYSLNRCLAASKGSLVARMDGDDVSRPDRLEKLVRYLAAHPNVDMVGSAMQRFDESGVKDLVVPERQPDRFSLRRGVPFCHATICARRHVYEQLRGYTVSKRTERGQDYDLWFRFYARGYVGHNVPEPLYWVREDNAAIRRRTLKVRFRSFQTAVIGFRMLGYPKRWYVAPSMALLKGFAPTPVVQEYRNWQHRRYLRQQSASGAGFRS